jgi:hypothetical protein
MPFGFPPETAFTFTGIPTASENSRRGHFVLNFAGIKTAPADAIVQNWCRVRTPSILDGRMLHP